MNKFDTTGVNSIKFTTDKNGRKIAHLWANSAMRWIRISLVEAEAAFFSETLLCEVVA
jgi:hypothetical protein